MDQHHIDGFNTYTSISQIFDSGIWKQAIGGQIAVGAGCYAGGNALVLNPGEYVTQKDIGGGGTYLGFKFGIVFKSPLTDAETPILAHGDMITGAIDWEVFALSTGEVIVKGNRAGKDSVSTTSVITPNTWTFIEIGGKPPRATNGLITVMVNGVDAAHISGTMMQGGDTRGGGPEHRFALRGGTGGTMFSDLYTYCSDSISTDDMGTFGAWRVFTGYASGDTAQADWSGSAADLDEALAPPLGDPGASFVASQAVGAKSEFTIEPFSQMPAEVYQVGISTVIAKDSSGPSGVAQYVVSGPTALRLGLVSPTNSAFLNYLCPHMRTDPNTGLAWTGDALAAMKLGVEIIA